MASKRKWGYYVLPFLLNERIVARVDLKADRKNSVLQVLAAHVEKGSETARVAKALAAELQILAEWLGLHGIRVSRKGGLAGDLRKMLR